MGDDGEQGSSPRAVFGSEMDAEQPEPSGQNGQDGQDSAHVEALQQRLQAPDAVMEPDIIDVLGDYMKSNMLLYGADADAVAVDVVRFLEGGYEGYAHMGSLVCSWLRGVEGNEDNDEEDEEEEEEDADDDRGPKRQRVGTPNSTTVRNSGTVNDNNNAAVTDVDGAPADEAWFLRELILEKFKPSTFENLFTSGGGGPPRWLNALVSEPGGRELIFQLSNKHDDSLLLSFALKKIVSKGYDEEVARKDVDLSRYFDVYHGILMVRLRALASTNDEREISRLNGLIQRSALSSMLGYLHVRQVLTRLASDGERKGKPWASRFRRMYQDLEAASKDGLACKMSRCFVELMCSKGDGEAKVDISFVAASVIGDVLATAVGGHVAPASDVIKLQQLYSGVALDDAGLKSGRLPSVTLLHHPLLVEVLLRTMFNPSKRLRGDALDAHAFVLSVAVCGLDEVSGETRGSSASIAEQPAVARLTGLIRAAVLLSHKATEDILLTEEEKLQARSSMSEGICATGVLVLLRKKLTSAEYWSSAYHVHKEPPFLTLLFSIVDTQPDMHGDVFSLVKDAMQAAGTLTAGTDVVMGLVRVLIELCKTGHVEDILAWAVSWARNANTDISRVLVLGLLEIAAPPYSGLFVESTVKLMNAANLRRQSMGSRLWNAKRDTIKEFYLNIEADHAHLALGKSEKSYLRDLGHCLT